jgi:hypothetical protein
VEREEGAVEEGDLLARAVEAGLPQRDAARQQVLLLDPLLEQQPVRPARRDLAQRVLLPRLRDDEGAGVSHGRGGGGGGFVSCASDRERGVSLGCECNGRGGRVSLKRLGKSQAKGGFAHLSGATVGIFSSGRTFRVSRWHFLVRASSTGPLPTVDSSWRQSGKAPAHY